MCCSVITLSFSGMEEIAYNSGPEKAQVQSVLLLTDGLANQGVTTREGILGEVVRIQNPPGEKVAQKVLFLLLKHYFSVKYVSVIYISTEI